MHVEYLALTMPLKKKTRDFLEPVFAFSILFFTKDIKTEVLTDFVHPHNDPGRDMKLLQFFTFSALMLEHVRKIRSLAQ